MKFKEALNKTYLRYWAGTKGEGTAMTNGSQLVEYFGGSKDVRKIDVNALDGVIKHFQNKGNSNSTINRKLSCLSKVMRYCYDRRIIEHIPKIEYLKENKHKVRILSDEEESKIAEYFFEQGDLEMSTFFRFGLETGLRKSDLLNLRYKDFDTCSGDLKVTISKTGKVVQIPLTKNVTDSLKFWGEDFKIDLKPSQVTYRWNKMKKALNIDDPELTPHNLRHTFATRLITRGANLVTVQNLLGHSNIQMTVRYSHPQRGDLREAIKLLGETS